MWKMRSGSLSKSELRLGRSDQAGDYLAFTTAHNPKTHRVELIITVTAVEGENHKVVQRIALNADELHELQEYLQSSDHEMIMEYDKVEMDKKFYEL